MATPRCRGQRKLPNRPLLARLLARLAVQAGLALDPTFTFSRFRKGALSSNPIYLSQRERIFDGMRKAGVPEGWRAHASSSSNTFASFRSSVSKPSVIRHRREANLPGFDTIKFRFLDDCGRWVTGQLSPVSRREHRSSRRLERCELSKAQTHGHVVVNCFHATPHEICLMPETRSAR